MRQLGEMEYRIVDTNQESGFLKAEKRAKQVPAWLIGEEWFNEITTTVMRSDEGAEVHLTVASSKQAEGEQRTSVGVSITKEARADEARLRAACL